MHGRVPDNDIMWTPKDWTKVDHPSWQYWVQVDTLFLLPGEPKAPLHEGILHQWEKCGGGRALRRDGIKSEAYPFIVIGPFIHFSGHRRIHQKMTYMRGSQYHKI